MSNMPPPENRAPMPLKSIFHHLPDLQNFFFEKTNRHGLCAGVRNSAARSLRRTAHAGILQNFSFAKLKQIRMPIIWIRRAGPRFEWKIIKQTEQLLNGQGH